jgi:hypothetical protein
VIHAAGVLDDGLIVGLDRERFERVCRPKIAGAWNLHRLTRHAELDFFVLFSSIASLVGSAGQGNYAAANAFLDALAISRSINGLPTLSINWGMWAEGGIGERLDPRHRARLASLGFRPIADAAGLGAFERALALQGHIAVLGADWSRYAAMHPRTSLVHGWAPTEETTPRGWLRTAIAAADPAGRFATMLASVCEQAGAVLRCEASQVAPRRGFFDQGMDSLLAMELKHRLDAALDEPLPATITFDHPSAEDLARYLLDRLEANPEPAPPPRDARDAADEIRKLSPEELEALIDREIDALLP